MRITNYVALKAYMGDWEYYVSTMRASDIVEYVKYAEEIFPNPELDSILQRNLAKRSEQIAEFLKNNTERFFGSLIIAVVGGNPKFTRVEIQGAEMLGVGNPLVGVLQFDGKENYYVLDGQHRVAALRSLKLDPGATLAKELISVILISHGRDPAGVQRARRLFTNLNRYAVKTNKGFNVAIEEDDGYAIIARRLIRQNEYFSAITKIAKVSSGGKETLVAGEALNPKSDSTSLMTLPTLYECTKYILGNSQKEQLDKQQQRPSEEVLEIAFNIAEKRWMSLLENIPAFQLNMERRTFDRSHESGGSVLHRPVGLKAYTMAVGEAYDTGQTLDEILKAGNFVDNLSDKPWKNLLWNPGSKRMEHGAARIKIASTVYRYWMKLDVDLVALRREIEAVGSSLPDQVP